MTKSNTVATKVINSSFAAKVIEPCDWTKQLNIPFPFRIFKFFHCVHVHLKMRLVQFSSEFIWGGFLQSVEKKIYESMNLHLKPPFPCYQKSDFCNWFFVKEKGSIICIIPPWQSQYCWPGEEDHPLRQDLNVLVGAIARWNSPRRPWQHL